MELRDLKRLVQTSPTDARITVETNKYGNTQAKAGLTVGERLTAWINNRKEYVTQNQNARTELAKTLRDSFGENFDTSRLKTLGNRALTTSQLATWIERGEKHLEKVAKKNGETAKSTLKHFDSALQQVCKAEGYKAPIHPKILEAVKSVVEMKIANHSPNLPPLKPEAADRMQLEILNALIAGFKTPENDRYGTSVFKDQPVLQRLVGFATKTDLTGNEFSIAARKLASIPYNKHTELQPEIFGLAAKSSSHVVDFIRNTDFSDIFSLTGRLHELLDGIGVDMEQASNRNMQIKNKQGEKLGPDETTAFTRTALSVAFERLDDKEVARLAKAFDSPAVRDLLGLFSGIASGFPVSQREFYAFPGQTEIVTKRTGEMLKDIMSLVQKHPASGNFRADSIEGTRYPNPESVPDQVWVAATDNLDLERGVLVRNN
jgi:hypothetical protein